MAARKKSSRQATARRIKLPKDPFAILVQFHQMRLRKMLKRGREEGNCLDCDNDLAPPTGPTAIARIPAWLVKLYLRIKWCMDVEQALESGIKFLQEHGDQLTTQQREDFRNDLAELLGMYADVC